MPARASDLERVARKLGFVKTRQRGSHARWKHPDGRATTIPIHPSIEIGGWLFYEILSQLGITEQEYDDLSFLAHDLHFIDDAAYQAILVSLTEVRRMLNSFIQRIHSSRALAKS